MIHHGQRAFTEAEMLDRLLTHVRIDGDCRIWAGGFTSCGNYPKVFWRGKVYHVRRLLLTLLGRPISQKQRVWPKCDNPACVAPDHIAVGSHAQLSYQASRRGRYCSGARRSLTVALGKAKNAKLPITEAPTVLRMRADGLSYRQIAEKYGVVYSAVGGALKAWARAGVTEHTAFALPKADTPVHNYDLHAASSSESLTRSGVPPAIAS